MTLPKQKLLDENQKKLIACVNDNPRIFQLMNDLLREEGYQAILSRIVKLTKSIIKDVPDLESPIGICTPGTIESETGLLKNSNTLCLIGKPIQKDMEKKHIEN